MTAAIQDIVDAYRRAGDWASIEGLHAHRVLLKQRLEGLAGGPLDVSKSIAALDEDLKVIEAALAHSPARQRTT